MSDTASEDSSAAAGGGVKYYWRRLSQQAYVMAHALGLKKLQEYMQGPNSLAVAPACLLGKFYGEEPEQEGDLVDASIAEDDIEALLQDFKSRLWFTYRKDVPPIGDTHMTSDTGWGCTIRTGQMLIGEALLRCRLGRGFRSSELQQQPGQVLELLQLFQDSPSPLHPLSIHHICQLGAPHGVVAGQWLGPWVLCKALEALVNAGQVQLGLRVHVVCEPGGGAPCLVLSRVKALFTGQLPLEGQGSGQAASDEEGGFVAVQHEEVAAAAGDAAGQAAAGEGGLPPLLLLVPLTLGVDVANPRYLPQLKAALTYPQSVGIVGGRPGSSLYFVGFQGDSLIHLDPHYPQQLAHLPQDLATFFCPTPRLTPLESIDPSLALGFICTTLGELDDLCTRLEALEQQAGGAPLLTMASGGGPPARACTPPLLSQGSLTLVDDAPGGSSAGGEWELL